MLLSIIIINYKTKELTANCLNSLFYLPNPETREIILIDNASNDGSAEYLENKFGNKIKLIKNDRNLGFAGANNQGATFAQGDYLIFLNSDTIVNQNFWSPCIDVIQNNKGIAIVSPRLKLPDGSYQKASFGIFPSFWNLLTQKTKKEIKINTAQNFQEVDWVSGCSLIIKKDVFEKIGGWDDHFFLYYEDIDICKTARKYGYKSAVVNNTKIIHLGGQSLSANKEKEIIYYTSQDYYFKKHHGVLISLLVKVVRRLSKIIRK